MGGSGLYHPPVKEWSGVATWADHTNRTTPSTEPGVDWYCRIGTDLFAAASGVVVEVNTWNVGPATGLFITLDLDDGRRVRYLHLSEIYVSVGQRVAFGQHIGKTGATGYGTWDWSGDPSTGGAHVHETVFRGHYYEFGRYATLDPWPLTDTENEMSPEQEANIVAKLDNILAFVGLGGTSTVDPKYPGGGGSIYARILNIQGFLYSGGSSVSDPTYVAAPGTIYNLLKTGKAAPVDVKALAAEIVQGLTEAGGASLTADDVADRVLERIGQAFSVAAEADTQEGDTHV